MDKPFAITLDVGYQPRQQDRLVAHRASGLHRPEPPCNDACPAGENIQAWLYEAEAGGDGYERAWRRIMEDNPFPAIMGRVCYHPCETACNRGQLDEAVGINSVERFVGDEAIRQGWTGRRRRCRRQESRSWSSVPGRPVWRRRTTSPDAGTRSPSRRPDRWPAA